MANKNIGPAWARTLRKATDFMVWGIPGGPRVLKFSWVINFQKAGTFIFLGLVMWWYADKTPAATSNAAWVYLALHGGYGLVWILKDITFPDPGWQHKVSLLGGLNGFLFVLGPYWLIGWLLISGTSTPNYPLSEGAWFCLCITLCLVGSVVMSAADAQKYFTLRVKRGLITDGVHKYIRHPNYLGEMMIYGSFALMAWHWLPILILAWVWLGLFAPNMALKEASMSRYPEWADYKKRSWWLIPGVF